MITRRNYIILAVTTLVLFALAAVIGDGRDVLWILDDVIFFGFLISAVLLLVMTVAVLVRAAGRSRANS